MCVYEKDNASHSSIPHDPFDDNTVSGALHEHYNTIVYLVNFMNTTYKIQVKSRSPEGIHKMPIGFGLNRKKLCNFINTEVVCSPVVPMKAG